RGGCPKSQYNRALRTRLLIVQPSRLNMRNLSEFVELTYNDFGLVFNATLNTLPEGTIHTNTGLTPCAVLYYVALT
ncbi:MAG: hypothetical protein KBT40_06105, partial [bacterium]|nr:hypothetical protein [Candidatus Minthenecus merdequi]